MPRSALRHQEGNLERLMGEEVTSVDKSPLFRLSGDEKGNPETYMTASLGLAENMDFFPLAGI